MGSRLQLQSLLEEILGSENVYFQPPTNTTMVYPCIVYERGTARTEFADNSPYVYKVQYQVTYISRNPDSDGIFHKLMMLSLCTHERFFRINNLNHDVFNLYF